MQEKHCHITALLTIALTVLVCGCSGASADKVEGQDWTGMEKTEPAKVILDTDMAYINDDTIAMFLLSQMDKCGAIELLGVTTVGGNVFAATATTAALKQLEIVDRSDIPVYQGTDVPLAGFRNMQEESKICGVPSFCGAYWDEQNNTFADMNARPTNYLDLGELAPYGYAERSAEAQSAWDFMIEQVHRYPGEVTIIAIGAATNVALAVKQDPDFARNAAGIIYMGGDIDVPGNATPAAEMNWFYDPDAIKLCLAAPWRHQTVVPDDLAQQVHWTPDFYDRLKAHEITAVTRFLLSGQRTFEGTEGADYVWDAVVPIVFLKPEIITDLQTRYLTVDTSSLLNSGRAVSWIPHSYNNFETGEGLPEGIQPVQIVMGIDEAAFWDACVDVLTAQYQ